MRFFTSWASPPKAKNAFKDALTKQRAIHAATERDGTKWQLNDPFFRSLSPNSYGDSERAIILTDEEGNSISDMLKQYAGLSKAIGADWRRMVYFSAVVITTLGLGDIIPLTSGARLLVAFEATFGIVIAGFFINAVAEAAEESLKSTTP